MSLRPESEYESVVSVGPVVPEKRNWTEHAAIAAAAVGAAGMSVALDARAHGGANDPASWWLAWSLTPDVAVALLLGLTVYARGVRHRATRRRRRNARFEAVFFGLGLLVLFLALQSPVDPLGERSFFMHQIQHLLLRSVGPLLLLLPSPQATLVAGLPSGLRRAAGRLGHVAGLKAFLGALMHPVSVTALFIASAYVWQYPPYFEAALRDDGVHYAMHVTMLLAGLLFWWRVFDDRPAGAAYGGRIVMLWAATAANILLGAYLTLKGGVLYPVYDELGRVWIDGPLDELIGGIVVWIPGSNMALIALLVVIRRWGRREESQHSRRATARGAAGGTGLSGGARQGSRRLGILLGLFSGGIFLGFIGFILLSLTGALP